MRPSEPEPEPWCPSPGICCSLESLPNWLFHIPHGSPQGASFLSGDSDHLHRAAGSHPAAAARLKCFVVQLWQTSQGSHTVSEWLPTAEDRACCMGGCPGWKVSLSRTSFLLCRQTSHLLSGIWVHTDQEGKMDSLQTWLFQSLFPRLGSLGESMKTSNDSPIP